MSNKVYVGNAKEINTNNGTLIKCGLRESDLETLRNHLNENGWVNVVVGQRRSVSQYGDTHSIWVDDWKPEQKPGNTSAGNPVPPIQTGTPNYPDGFDDFSDDIPFS